MFNSRGEWIAFRHGQGVFDERCNWIGWLPWGNHEVATQEGDYLGTIVDVNRPKGFGFVEMTSQVEAQKAIEMFNEHELDGRRMTVNFARPKEDRGGSRGGYGGGRNRY